MQFQEPIPKAPRPPLMPRVPHDSPAALPSHALPGLSPGLWGLIEQLDAADQPQPEALLGMPCGVSPLAEPRLLAVSPSAAALIGEDPQAIRQSTAWRDWLSGCGRHPDQPSYATAYAGHQFGVAVPRLGDGRALNLGQTKGWELQLKGAGPTPYARGADGRAVLRSSVREFLASEYLHALGIPSTRALSLSGATTTVMRETAEPAAVVCRMAPSFLRLGHVEFLAEVGRASAIDALLQSVMREQPDWPAPSADPMADRLAFLEELARRTARLMALWTAEGFVHGVMNSDNFSLLGLTIDYGPFGFVEAFDAHQVFNHSDHSGRYAFAQQPSVGLWNLMRLANALGLPAHGYPEDALIAVYQTAFTAAFYTRMGSKLGLPAQPELEPLLDRLYPMLQATRLDHGLFWRALSDQASRITGQSLTPELAMDFAQAAGATALSETGLGQVHDWLVQYQQARHSAATSDVDSGHAAQDPLPQPHNPRYVLRNWVLEAVIRALQDEGDDAPLQLALKVFSSPYDEHPEAQAWQAAPPAWAQDLALSCSS